MTEKGAKMCRGHTLECFLRRAARLIHYTPEERQNIANQIGVVFGIENAGLKMTEEGWRMESRGKRFLLTVELVSTISKEQAEAILNARPITEEKPE